MLKSGKSDIIPAKHLNAMLKSAKFLGQFRPLDQITARPLYLPDFSLTHPGYNDGGPGYRILLRGRGARGSHLLRRHQQVS